MNGDEDQGADAELELQRILGELEHVLVDLDLLKLHLPGAYVSQAIEHIRSLL
jgi:hypothetical protein